MRGDEEGREGTRWSTGGSPGSGPTLRDTVLADARHCTFVQTPTTA